MAVVSVCHSPIASKCHGASAPVAAHVHAVEVQGRIMETVSAKDGDSTRRVDVTPGEDAQDGGLACAENVCT